MIGGHGVAWCAFAAGCVMAAVRCRARVQRRARWLAFSLREKFLDKLCKSILDWKWGKGPGMCCPVVPGDTDFQAFSLRGRQCMIQLLRHGENIAERQCLPCIRGGGTVLCTVTEGLQIPAAAQDETHQSLSQPDG